MIYFVCKLVVSKKVIFLHYTFTFLKKYFLYRSYGRFVLDLFIYFLIIQNFPLTFLVIHFPTSICLLKLTLFYVSISSNPYMFAFQKYSISEEEKKK